MSTHDILHRLSETLASRRHADPETSYTAKLFANGPDSILKKIGEESTEVVIAGKAGDREETVYEIADLAYHLMVLMVEMGLTNADILRELAKRHVVDKKVKQEKMQ